MGRIVVTEHISVDGVAEAPSRTDSFGRVGWTDAFTRGPEGDKFKLDMIRGDVVEEVSRQILVYEKVA